jgi:hypothetical protein
MLVPPAVSGTPVWSLEGDSDRMKLRKLRSSALADAIGHVERDGVCSLRV